MFVIAPFDWLYHAVNCAVVLSGTNLMGLAPVVGVRPSSNGAKFSMVVPLQECVPDFNFLSLPPLLDPLLVGRHLFGRLEGHEGRQGTPDGQDDGDDAADDDRFDVDVDVDGLQDAEVDDVRNDEDGRDDGGPDGDEADVVILETFQE